MKEVRRRGGVLRTAGVFTLGAAIGSIIALLFAPASGQVTRRRLAMKARNLQRVMTRRLGQTQRALVTRAEHVREAATEWIAGHLPQGNGRSQHRETRHA